MQWAPFTGGEPPARAQCAACSEATLAGGHAAHGGLELTTSGRLPGRWDVSTCYAWLDGRMTKSLATTGSLQLPVAAIPALGKVPALTPRNSAFLWAMKDLGHGLRVGGGVNYVGTRFTSLTNLVTRCGRGFEGGCQQGQPINFKNFWPLALDG